MDWNMDWNGGMDHGMDYGNFGYSRRHHFLPSFIPFHLQCVLY